MKLSTIATYAGAGWSAYRAYQAHQAGVPVLEAFKHPFVSVPQLAEAMRAARLAALAKQVALVPAKK